MKQCRTCKTIKQLNDFYKCPGFKDGHHNQCKTCHKAYTIRWKKQNPDKWHPIKQRGDKKYRQSPKGKEAKKRGTAKYRKTIKYTETQQRARLKWLTKPDSKLKLKARSVVGNAVQSGRLPRISTQNCKICKKQAEHYHHHISYELKNALDVIPLCMKCHI